MISPIGLSFRPLKSRVFLPLPPRRPALGELSPTHVRRKAAAPGGWPPLALPATPSLHCLRTPVLPRTFRPQASCLAWPLGQACAQQRVRSGPAPPVGARPPVPHKTAAAQCPAARWPRDQSSCDGTSNRLTAKGRRFPPGLEGAARLLWLRGHRHRHQRDRPGGRPCGDCSARRLSLRVACQSPAPLTGPQPWLGSTDPATTLPAPSA